LPLRPFIRRCWKGRV